MSEASPNISRRGVLLTGATALATAAMPSTVVAQNAQSQTGKQAKPSRVILGSGLPTAMPGWELSLRRVMFPPGAMVPGEIHSGMQVIYIVSGTLNLKVLGGEAQVRRVKADGSQGEVETFKPSATEVVLTAGDTVLEPETLVLAPRNAGSEPLVILTASLFPVGQPQSIEITQSITVSK